MHFTCWPCPCDKSLESHPAHLSLPSSVKVLATCMCVSSSAWPVLGTLTCPHLYFLSPFFPKYRPEKAFTRALHALGVLRGLDTLCSHVCWPQESPRKKSTMAHSPSLSAFCDHWTHMWRTVLGGDSILTFKWETGSFQGSERKSLWDLCRPLGLKVERASGFKALCKWGEKVDTFRLHEHKIFLHIQFFLKQVIHLEKYLQFISQTNNKLLKTD